MNVYEHGRVQRHVLIEEEYTARDGWAIRVTSSASGHDVVVYDEDPMRCLGRAICAAAASGAWTTIPSPVVNAMVMRTIKAATT